MTVELMMDEELYNFYRKLGLASGTPAEWVMADLLFKLAGEASLQALHQKKRSSESGRP